MRVRGGTGLRTSARRRCGARGGHGVRRGNLRSGIAIYREFPIVVYGHKLHAQHIIRCNVCINTDATHVVEMRQKCAKCSIIIPP